MFHFRHTRMLSSCTTPMTSQPIVSLGYPMKTWYVSNVSIIFDCSMLYYLLFWTILGFIIHFYIIFGTNLLIGGPAQNAVFFSYFRVSKKRNIKRSPNGMKPSGTWFLERTRSRRLGPYVKQPTGRPRGRGARLPPQARPPPLWAPYCSTDVLLPPIYTYVPPNDQIRSQKPNSTATTFCTHEIPSWGLFRSSAGGASITEGFYINTIAPPMKCE